MYAFLVLGRKDMDVVVDYLKRKGPVIAGLDGRIKLLNGSS